MRRDLLELIYEHDELADLDPAGRRIALRALLADHVEPASLPAAVREVADTIDGYGPLTDLMADGDVTDVLINGPDEIWIERSGALQRTDRRFDSTGELITFAQRLLATAGERADVSSPIADARLSDGTRIHVVMPPIAPGGPLVSFRRWPERRLTLADLVAAGTLTKSALDELVALVAARRSIIVSGATGTGKTTLLNALLDFVGSDERVVIVEEIAELAPACAHFARLVSRRPGVEGTGSVELDDLVRAALRMRPDRIVVGEVRGPEALAALAAMSTGHEGSMLTVHAPSPRDALRRIVALALQAGSGLTEAAVEARALRAIDVVVQLARAEGNRRRVVAIENVR